MVILYKMSMWPPYLKQIGHLDNIFSVFNCHKPTKNWLNSIFVDCSVLWYWNDQHPKWNSFPYFKWKRELTFLLIDAKITYRMCRKLRNRLWSAKAMRILYKEMFLCCQEVVSLIKAAAYWLHICNFIQLLCTFCNPLLPDIDTHTCTYIHTYTRTHVHTCIFIHFHQKTPPDALSCHWDGSRVLLLCWRYVPPSEVAKGRGHSSKGVPLSPW